MGRRKRVEQDFRAAGWTDTDIVPDESTEKLAPVSARVVDGELSRVGRGA